MNPSRIATSLFFRAVYAIYQLFCSRMVAVVKGAPGGERVLAMGRRQGPFEMMGLRV
jgi:hypothetical protein